MGLRGVDGVSEIAEIRRITECADRLEVEPILSTEQALNIFGTDAILEADMGTEGSVCTMKCGAILTPDPTSAATLTALQLCDLRDLTAKVRPTLSRVVADLILGTADPVENTEQVLTDRSQVQKLLNELLSVALHKRATDIHIEIRHGQKARVRLRIDGLLRLHETLEEKIACALGSVLFTSESEKGSEFSMTAARETSLKQIVNGQNVPVRISTIPEFRGVDILLRLDILGAEGKTMKSLGLAPADIIALTAAAKSPHGLLIFSGPPGAGKSTLMRALVRTLPDTLKITFLEDPVEDVLPNATHVHMDEKVAASSIASMQKSITRWDGDVNVLGEIRDFESIKATQTLVLLGRRVLATVHATRVLSIPTRLAQLGLERELLSEPGFLRLLVNQRLLSVVCKTCALPLEDNSQNREQWGEHFETVRRTNPEGCDDCVLGSKGRVLVSEHLVVTDEDREFIAAGDTLGWKKSLQDRGWKGIEEPTLSQVRAGNVDPDIAAQLVGLPEDIK